MKFLLLILLILLGISFSACASKDKNYYNRAIKASEKSLQGLEQDTK